ncbi:SpoVG family protein [Ruminococcaceae bacterium OttesenSCG-928-A11]|nr:SpoVG family protein [Ruminococcaceae bacterium OttesenSCG-928-A11]
MSDTQANPAAENVKLDVRVFPIKEPKSNTVALANVTVADLVAISGVRVVDSEKGLFVSMPQAKDGKGEYRDIAFPVMKGLRPLINKAVLDAYTAEKEKEQAKPSVADQVKDGAKKTKAQPKKEAPAKGDDAR